MVFNGSCNTNLFNSWIEQSLIKELKPGQVVIMDNASFHKSQNWTLDKFHPYLGIKFVTIKETCINQILVCS